MYRIICLAVAITVCASCKCRQEAQTLHTDSIFITNEKILIKTRVDTFNIYLPIEVKEATRQDSSTLEIATAKSVAMITKNGLLFHNLTTKKTPIPTPIILTDTLIVRDTLKSTAKERIILKEVKTPLKKWQRFLLFIGFGCTVYVLTRLFLVLRKKIT